jgi:hypothetical protein
MSQSVRVPVADVVFAAFRSVFGRLGLVLELGWLPLLIILAALLLPDLAGRYLVAGGPASASTDFDIGDLIQETVVALCLSAFALRWYRLVLLADPRALPRRIFAGVWVRFMAYTVSVGVLVGALTAAMVLAIPAADDSGAVAVATRTLVGVAATAVSLGIARMSLLFPAAAYGAPLGLGAAWRAMRGNSWRLVGANVMAVMPIVLFVNLLVSLLAGAHLLSPDELADNPPLGLILLDGVVIAVLSLIMAALGASILSEFYRRIMLHEMKGG